MTRLFSAQRGRYPEAEPAAGGAIARHTSFGEGLAEVVTVASLVISTRMLIDATKNCDATSWFRRRVPLAVSGPGGKRPAWRHSLLPRLVAHVDPAEAVVADQQWAFQRVLAGVWR